MHAQGSYSTRVAPKSDEPEQLPEPTPFLADDDELDEGDGADLLQVEDGAPDLDDSTASDLDPGIDLDETESDTGTDESIVLDVGDLLDGREAAPHLDDEADDAVLAEDLFGDRNIGSFSTDDTDDSTSNEGFVDLIDESLPGLDADDGEEAAADALFDTAVLAEGEELPRRAELMWGEIPLARAEAPRTVVRIVREGAVTFGSDVALVSESGSRRVVTAVPGVVRSAVVDAAASLLLYATQAGALFRVALSDSEPEPLVAYRDAVGPSGASPELALGGPTPSARPALLLHVGGAARALVESTDHGKTWRRVDLGGPVLALSVGSPPACLVAAERGTRLFRSEPSGGFTAVGASWPADAEVPSLATHGDVVVALEPGALLRVSADGGVTFKPAARTTLATAITAGRLGSRPWAFAALFEPTSGRTALVSIDAATGDAFVIGYIEPEGDEDADEACRVVSLAWDEGEETLYAAGEFGLARFRRPPSA